MILIVGLGNPDRRYRGTRHNVGWDIVDRLATRWRIAVEHEEGSAKVGRGQRASRRVLLAKPQTYVNLSGVAVRDLQRRHHVKVEDIYVIVDDMDLPLGRLRIRPKGGPGGHKGLQSVIDALGSEVFPRVRVGVGRPPEGQDPVDFVLTRFAASERAVIDVALDRAAEAIDVAVTQGLAAAMNQVNAKATAKAPA
jgi:PTH1 family peptidyl-tRNA hydrolase